MQPIALLALAVAAPAQATWTQRYPASSPPARSLHAMAYDPTRQGIVLFGGSSAQQTALADTWEWSLDATSGAYTWRQLPVAGPAARGGHGMVFDSARQRLVLYGGVNDLWELGQAWTQRTPPVLPPRRWDLGMAYDPLRQQTVIFGGTDSANAGLADTWTWDGTSWTNRTPAVSPPPRWDHTMAWDAARGSVVLFGGQNAKALFADTWTWDGTAWQQQTPRQSPPIGPKGALAYDEARARVVYCGEGSPFPWEWDGTDWQMIVTAAPTPRHTALAYHAGSGRVLLFGGKSPLWAPPFADTWEYFFAPAARWSALGAGCAGSAGTLTLAPQGNALPWFGEAPFPLVLAPLPAAGNALAWLGGSASSWMGFALPLDLTIAGMPGCALHAGPDLLVALTGQGGAATWTLAFPPDPTIVGQTVYAQGLALDPGANAAGALTSNGGAITVGSR